MTKCTSLSKWGNILSSNKIILRQKKCARQKELWTSQSSSNANHFHFLESKICFVLKQIQTLNNKFYCAYIRNIHTPEKSSIWSYKQTYFSVEKNCNAPSISKYRRKRFGTGLVEEWTDWRPWSISKFSKRQYFQQKLNFRVFKISNLVHGSIE